MNFYVKFRAKETIGEMYQERGIGLRILDKIREQTAPDLDIDLVEQCPRFFNQREFHVIITEEQARESGLFEHCSTRTVLVNGSHRPVPVFEIDQDRETGKVNKVVVEFYPDIEVLMQAWIESDYAKEITF